VDTGVRQFVDQDQSIAPDQHRNNAGVGEVAGAKGTGSFGSLDARETGFKLDVERVIAGHQPGRAGSGAIFLDSGDGCAFYLRMLGEVEVVVA
jgi:hypothetical protein